MNQNGNMNINEFKGIYYNDNKQQKYFEGGAHFNYKELYHILENLQSLIDKSDTNRITKNHLTKVITIYVNFKLIAKNEKCKINKRYRF